MPTAVSSQTPWRQNNNYKVLIQKHGAHAGYLIAYTPEEFGLRLQSHWEQMFANLLDGKIGGIQAALSAAGIGNFYIKDLTGHVWRGTDAIQFSLPLKFDARESALVDVHEPIEKLVRWTSPTQSGNMVIPPGASLISSENRISLRIGQYMYFDSVIIPGIDIKWHNMMDSTGIPIAADVDIEFRTFYTLTADEILQVFSHAQSTSFYNSGVTSSTPGGVGQTIGDLINSFRGNTNPSSAVRGTNPDYGGQ